jgi:hypothetical protein
MTHTGQLDNTCSRSSEDPARQSPGVSAVVNNGNTVDDHVSDA